MSGDEGDARAHGIVIVAGPFPARWKTVGFGLLMALVFGFTLAFGLRTTQFDCLRSVGQPAACTLVESAPLGRTVQYGSGDVARVEMFERAGAKANSPPRFCVTLLDWRGAETDIEEFSKRDVAEAERDRLRAFLADPTALTFERVRRPTVLSYLLFVAVLCVSAAVGASGFATAGRLHVALDAARRTVRVRRTLFGVTWRRSIQHAANEIVDARLEHGPVADWQRRRYALPESGARLVLVDAHGRALPTTRDYLCSPSTLQAALDELREALGLADPNEANDPNDPNDPNEAEVATQTVAAAPTVATAPPVASGWAAWRGPLRLFGGVTLVAIVGEGIVLLYADQTQGWLEVKARSRCEFGGGTLLPGAQMSVSLDPGSYQIRVFNPRLPDGWEVQHFEVQRHETTYVSCSPKAVPPP